MSGEPEPDRRDPDSRRKNLEARITDLAIAVVGMKGAMEALATALQQDVQQVSDQLARQRRLAKWNRRTWFQVMSYIFVAGILVSDLGRRYCQAEGDSVTWARSCDVAFWTTPHGGGFWWRLFGALFQAGLLFFMWKRSQVPPDLESEVASYQVRQEREERRNRRRSS